MPIIPTRGLGLLLAAQSLKFLLPGPWLKRFAYFFS